MFAAFKKEDLNNVKRLKDFLNQKNISIDDMVEIIKVERFKIKDFQNLFMVKDILDIEKESFENLNELIEKEEEKQIENQRKNFKELGRPCPTKSCEGKLMPFPGNEEGGEAVWVCRNCRYSEYDGRTVAEIIKEFKDGSPKL